MRRYKGYEIKDWSGPYGSYPDAGEPKYFIQTQHAPTGIDWSAENCPKAWSLREAREKINDLELRWGKSK
jgi:hypothetical protein